MRLFYNTNGFAHHRLQDLVSILESLGFDGVSLTLDVGHADLQAAAGSLDDCAALLRASPLDVVIETGGRFVLDPWRKHRPNLCDEGAEGELRLDYYRRAVDFAVAVGAPLVSLWSGVLPEGCDRATALDRLAGRLDRLCDHAADRNVSICFEPEPGMLIDTLACYESLAERLGGERLRLTCDLGHLYCTETPPYPELLRRYAGRLANVHIDDIAGGEHVHLELGEGDIRFRPLLGALAEIGYKGPVSAELSRSSHRAVEAARNTIAALRQLIEEIERA